MSDPYLVIPTQLKNVMTPLSHSPFFWVDTIGLLLQSGFLWFAAGRLQKSDWPAGLSFVVTCVLSLFCAFWPVFDLETADYIRRALHGSTAVSFIVMTVLIIRDYRERKGEGSINVNWKVIGGAFLFLMLLIWSTVTMIVSMGFDGQKAERQLTDIQRKAATAAGVGMSTQELALENKEMLIAYGERMDKMENAINALLIYAQHMPALKGDLQNLKGDIRRLRLDIARKPNVIYLPERMQPKAQGIDPALSPYRVQPLFRPKK